MKSKFRKLNKKQVERIWELHARGTRNPLDIIKILGLPVTWGVISDILNGRSYKDWKPIYEGDNLKCYKVIFNEARVEVYVISHSIIYVAQVYHTAKMILELGPGEYL
ncbi:MAG: hypothetical protein KAS32_19535 [Candidatus Peribacteraceae bacterium]|nr:hypothetical protein [Candidatus Peribacteraceae bacterium]